MSDDKEQSFYSMIRPLLRKYLPPYIWLVAGVTLAGVLAAAASGFGLPVIVQKVCPVVFGTVPAPEWLTELLGRWYAPEEMPTATLVLAACIIPVVMSVRGLTTYLNSYLLTKAGMGLMTDLRTDVFSRLQWLSFSFHDRHQRGALMTTVIQYTQSLQLTMVQVLNDLVVQPLTLIAAVGYLVYAALTNSESAVLLGTLLISCLCIPLVRWVGKSVLKKMRKVLNEMNRITENVEETLAAQREVRAFNLERMREDLLNVVVRKYNKLLIRVAAWQGALSRYRGGQRPGSCLLAVPRLRRWSYLGGVHGYCHSFLFLLRSH